MHIEGNEGLRGILDLRSIIEKVYFKEHEESFNFPANINHTHIKTMIFLYFDGEKSMSMVSDKLNMEKGSFTPVANHLIKYGFIEKSPNSKDKRVFNLHLTEKGRAFTLEIVISHNSYVNKLLESLSEEEKDSYLSAIKLINDLTIKMQSGKK